MRRRRRGYCGREDVTRRGGGPTSRWHRRCPSSSTSRPTACRGRRAPSRRRGNPRPVRRPCRETARCDHPRCRAVRPLPVRDTSARWPHRLAGRAKRKQHRHRRDHQDRGNACEYGNPVSPHCFAFLEKREFGDDAALFRGPLQPPNEKGRTQQGSPVSRPKRSFPVAAPAWKGASAAPFQEGDHQQKVAACALFSP